VVTGKSGVEVPWTISLARLASAFTFGVGGGGVEQDTISTNIAATLTAERITALRIVHTSL